MDSIGTEVQYPRLRRRVRAFLIDSVLFIIIIYVWMIFLTGPERIPLRAKDIGIDCPNGSS